MNITAIFLPFYVIVKALVTYPTGDIDIYIDAYTQNDTINDLSELVSRTINQISIN